MKKRFTEEQVIICSMTSLPAIQIELRHFDPGTSLSSPARGSSFHSLGLQGGRGKA